MKRFVMILVMLSGFIFSSDTVPGHIIVSLSSVQAKSFSRSVYHDYGLDLIRTLPSSTGEGRLSRSLSTTVIVKTDQDDVSSIVKDLENDPRVHYAEPIYNVSISNVQNDPQYYKQDYLHSTSIPYIWGMDVGAPTTIAIVDTGVDYLHEDLVDVMDTNIAELDNGIDDDGNGVVDDIRGYNFYNYYIGFDTNDPMDVHSHGTHLAGIAAASTGNDVGIAGIAQNVRILPIRFLNENGEGNQVDAAYAIRYAADMGVDVINCSWGFVRYNQVLFEAIQYAVGKGVIVIAAVGNLGDDITEYPAGFNEVIAIGACSDYDDVSSFSSYGSHLDFLMYGERIYSTSLNDSYTYKSGSSQSTAIVSGLVASLKSYDMTYEFDDVYALLRSSATASNDFSRQEGYGVIQTNQLLENLSLDLIDFPVVSESTAVTLADVLPFPNPATESMKFGMESTETAMDITVDIYDLQGRKRRSLSKTIGSGYQTVEWDLKDRSGVEVLNGTYIYVVTGERSGEKTTSRGLCTVLK